jgi:phage-related protein
VFALLKIAIGAVIAVFELWWHSVQIALHTIGGFFTWLWGFVSPFFSWLGGAMDRAGQLFMILWGFVSQYFTAIWGAFQQFLGIVGSVLSAVGGFFSWLWGYIAPYFSWVGTALTATGGFFTGLWNTVSGVFSSIGSFIASKVGEIVGYATGFGGFVVNALSHFTAFVNGIRGKIDNAADFVHGLPGRIMDAVGNLGSLLWNAGQNVIQGLIDGISSRIGALRDKIAAAAQTIRNALPFSPAKEGPLSGGGDPTIAGSKIVSMVGAGIEAQIPTLRLTAYQLADAAHPAPPIGAKPVSLGVPMTPLSSAATTSLRGAQRGAGAPGMGGNTYNLTVNSIDPRTAGAVVIKAIAEWERSNGKAWRQWH